MLVTGVHISNGARILGLFPMPGKSHMVVNAALMKELAYRGHEVTVVSPFPENKKIPNYKDIVLDLNVYERFLSETGK
jgi:glucuronosyltransferase